MPHHRTSFDVAIVGGGVIGLAVGWRAAQRGCRVTVLERDRPGGGTSWVSAGMLAPVTEARLAERPLLELGLQAAHLYPSFVAELIDSTGIDPGYLDCGTLLAARDGDEAESLARELQVRQSLGLPAWPRRASEARRLEPSLAPSLRLALEIPDDHAINPRKLTAALAEALRRAGGELRTGAEVVEVAVTEGRAQGVVLDRAEQLSAGQVVVAAGAWSGRLGGIPQEARVPIHPVKGQILRMHDPAGPGMLTRVLRTGAGGYVVPRGDGCYVLGATMEERGFDTTVTAGAMFELLRDAIELVPSLTELVIDELSAGLRPATPDNAPAIGPGLVEGLHWATGHYRNGVLLAPITAQILASAITGEEAPAVAAGFTPRRFEHAAVPA